MDVDWIALRLSRDIATAALPYAQGVVYGIAYGATDVFHMASRPIETCKDLGKTICFALETAALNCVEDESMAPESYKLKRDQRNEQVAQALHKLGDQMANSTGPERVEALARFGTNLVLPGKVIHAVGEVSGVIRSQAKILRTLEGVAPALSEELGFETSVQELTKTVQKIEHAAQENIAKNLAAELMQELTKTVQKIEHAAQENIAKNLAAELMETEKGIEKAGKVASGSKATPPRTLATKKSSALRDAQRVADKTIELPDGRMRYYEKIKPSDTPGPTSGRSFVTEFDPKTGRVRQWQECYDHSGNVNRIRPTMVNGRAIASQHYPATYKDMQNNIKGSKWNIPKKNLD
ncbi:MAG: hypothetical protein NTU89_04525 [Candidatus Dependentiae bacterium]|nr:hypothetical protein [Candidatus Dependentiae bacterium]